MNSGKIKRGRRRFMGVVIPLLVVAIPCLLTYRAVRQQRLDRALSNAARQNDVIMIRDLIQQGADPNVPEYQRSDQTMLDRIWDRFRGQYSAPVLDGYPLSEAAEWRPPGRDWPQKPHDNVNTVQVLLDAGADVDAADCTTATPLIIAAGLGKMEVAQALLAHKANVNATSDRGITALDVAVEHKHIAIAKMLLAHRANVNAIDDKGETALMKAASHEFADFAEMLLEAGADANIHAKSGETALLIALASYDVAHTSDKHRIVQALLQHGALTTGRDVSGDTPLHSAMDAHDPWLVRVLRRAGARE